MLALASMQVKVISRGKGRAKVSSTAYRSGEQRSGTSPEKTSCSPRQQEEVSTTVEQDEEA